MGGGVATKKQIGHYTSLAKYIAKSDQGGERTGNRLLERRGAKWDMENMEKTRGMGRKHRSRAARNIYKRIRIKENQS